MQEYDDEWYPEHSRITPKFEQSGDIQEFVSKGKDWYVIAYCARENAYGEMLPAEWFIKDAPFASREEAENQQARIVENTRGTDAEWPEANASAKIVHRDDLAQYGLKPFNDGVAL